MEESVVVEQRPCTSQRMKDDHVSITPPDVSPAWLFSLTRTGDQASRRIEKCKQSVCLKIGVGHYHQQSHTLKKDGR